ncbi:FkbM family methyltransferase [Azospirillum brasilense]|nr:FkbM family methyltransferase [Azospirillum brasilense]
MQHETLPLPGLSLQKAFLPPEAKLVAVGNGAGRWTDSAAGRACLALPSSRPTLDSWCGPVGPRHIDWLVLDGCGDALAVLDGAAELLRLRRIDFLQFEEAEAGGPLAALYERLQANGYSLFRFADRNLEFRGTHMAVAPRHWNRLFARSQGMFRYKDLFPRHGVVPRGIIHVGAHEGEEYTNYQEAGGARVLFVEADPATFATLQTRFAGNGDVVCLNAAVSDTAGRGRFSRMSSRQSSSLLEPTGHLTVYPHITVDEVIEVETRTLPDLLASNGLAPEDFNVLAIDAQGSECRILNGCGDLLPRFDAVMTEVSYAELYKGSGLAADVDDILFAHGFARVAETSPYHHSWGDALYVRRPG